MIRKEIVYIDENGVHKPPAEKLIDVYRSIDKYGAWEKGRSKALLSSGTLEEIERAFLIESENFKENHNGQE